MRPVSCVAAALASCAALAASASAQQEFTLRGFGGVTFSGELDSSFTIVSPPDPTVTEEGSLDLETGFVVGGAAGLNVQNFTFEGELAYRGADVEGIPDLEEEIGDLDVSANVLSIMANGWYNAPLSDRLVGYGGGGIGLARGALEFDIANLASVEFEGDYSFAWQLGAGVKYLVSDRTSLGVGYRYFNASDAVDDEIGFDEDGFSLTGDYSDSSIIAEIGLTF